MISRRAKGEGEVSYAVEYTRDVWLPIVLLCSTNVNVQLLRWGAPVDNGERGCIRFGSRFHALYWLPRG